MKVISAAWVLLGAASSVLAQPMRGVGSLSAEVAAPGRVPTMSCQSLAKVQHVSTAPLAALQQSASDPAPPCAVTATVKSSRGSNVKMELWMPSRDWNGKLVVIGGDGGDASQPHAEMVEPLHRGYAVGATGSSAAAHDTLVKAKALTAAYYGAAPRYMYWSGNTFGSGEALKEVETYPSDFDGVIVGTSTSVDAVAPDLSAFKMRGGKIVQYHDRFDAAVRPNPSADYFERVATKQGGFEQTMTFYRLFLIPVPEHANEAFSEDWLATLEEWVERGRAPDSVLANHLPPPNAVLTPPPPGAVVFEPPFGVRVMCAYPGIAKLQGGTGEVPADWICQPGPRGSKAD